MVRVASSLPKERNQKKGACFKPRENNNLGLLVDGKTKEKRLGQLESLDKFIRQYTGNTQMIHYDRESSV